MSFNSQRSQQRRQQEQMRRQQEQMRRRQQQAWAAEQEKKRKRRKRESRLQQSGGINISDSDNLGVRGDLVGRDKYNQINASYERDEKNSFILFIERFFAFIITGGVVMVIAVVVASSSEDAFPIVMIVGAIVALLFAISTASSISRYRD